MYRHFVGVTSPQFEQFFITGQIPHGICTKPGGGSGELIAL